MLRTTGSISRGYAGHQRLHNRFQVGSPRNSPLGQLGGAAPAPASGLESLPEKRRRIHTARRACQDDLGLGALDRQHRYRAACRHGKSHLPRPDRSPFREDSPHDGTACSHRFALPDPQACRHVRQFHFRPLCPAPLVLLFRAETLKCGREFTRTHGEGTRQPLHQFALRVAMPDNPVAAEEGDANILTAPFLAEDQQRPHSRRGGRMGTATRGVIHARDGDDPDRAVHGGLLPEGKGGELLLRHEASVDREGALNQIVGRPFDLIQDVVAQGRGGKVDRDLLRAEMKPDGPEPAECGEHGGEEVLTEVLLHVIEAAGPVDRAGDRGRGGREWRLENVAEGAFLIHLDVEDPDGVQVPVIRGLSASLGIEGRPVENHGRVILPRVPGENPGGEGGQCRVSEVEAFRGHGAAVYLARPPATTPRSPHPWRPMPALSHDTKGATSSAHLPESATGGAGRMLFLVGMAELLGMSVWLAASVVAPELRVRGDLTAAQAGWLTSAVQLGFVGGTLLAAVLNLADLLPVRWYFAAGAVGAAGANLALLVVPGFSLAVLSRLVTGFFLAAVYPPAMKMVATWYRSGRGLAIGVVVGALTVGKATPYLVEALGGVGFRPVILTTTAAAGLAAILVTVGYREGPWPFSRRAFSWSLVGQVVRVRGWRLTTAGYCGHMIELYACWTWLATFLGAGALAAGDTVSHRGVALATFGAIGIGGLACVWGGRVADRIGRERLVRSAMVASGACALLTGAAWSLGFGALVAVAVVWGWFVIADSAQFSTLVTEQVPSHAVGTALTLQTSIGFAISTISIQAVPRMADWLGWQWSFGVLALGPALGVLAIERLRRS